MNEIYRQALEYVRRGVSVIPVGRDKKPLIPWKEYQTRLPTEDEIIRWSKQYPDANIAIVTGQISGLTVMDCDSNEAYESAKKRGLPKTPTVKSGRGYHPYCKYRVGVGNFQKRGDLPGIDLRGDGGYVIAPPSVHANGNKYEWLPGSGLDDLPLAGLPDWVLNQENSVSKPLKGLYSGAEKGSRNDSLARLVGSWVNDGLGYEACLNMAHVINKNNRPPLPGREVESIVSSICAIHSKKPQVEVVEDVEDDISNIFPSVAFPLDTLPEDLRNFVMRAAESFCIPEGVVVASAITVISSTIGNSVRISPKNDWFEPTFLWLAIVGASGSGKSPFINKLIEPIHKWEREQMELNIEALIKYNIDLRRWKRSKTDEPEPKKPKFCHFLVSDTTVEALAHTFQGSPRGVLLHSDEISSIICSWNQYKKVGNDRQKFIELWNCKPWSVHRVGITDMYIPYTGCAILGGIQPLAAPRIFREDSFIDGLLPRFLICRIPFGGEVTDASLSSYDMSLWGQILEKIKLPINIIEGDIGRIVRFNQEACKAFLAIRKEFKQRQLLLPSRAEVFVPKLVSYLVRIAGILHILDHRDEGIIGEDTIYAAKKIIDYFSGQAMCFLKEYGSGRIWSELEKELIVHLFKLKDRVQNGHLKLSEVAERINENRSDGLKLRNETIARTLRGLHIATKLIGGHSHVIWGSRIEKLYTMIASTTSTTST